MESVCFPDGVAGMSKGLCVGGWEEGGRRVQGLFRGQEEVSLKGSLGTGREQKQVRWARLYPPGYGGQQNAIRHEQAGGFGLNSVGRGVWWQGLVSESVKT